MLGGHGKATVKWINSHVSASGKRHAGEPEKEQEGGK
jgi:hypothetical protein